MRRSKDVFLAGLLATSFLGPRPATATDLDADLREALRAQAEIIQQLRDELDHVREDQRSSEDRVRALEDERVNDSTSAIDADFVDRRIEQFDTADESRLSLSGYGTAQFMSPEGGPSTFGVQFNPIFHFRLTDRLHFNAEFEVKLERDEGEGGEGTTTDLGMEFATIDYLAADWLTLTAGQFLVPFNYFGARLHPQWINKIASLPPIYRTHDGGTGIIPILNDVGIMASGGAPLWSDDSKFSYAVYLTNGWGRAMGDGDGGAEDGLDFIYGTTPDINDAKSVGGRIAFLPIPNLEVAGSYQTSRANGPDGRYHLIGMDVSYWHEGLDLRGESIRLSRDDRVEGNLDKWGYYLQAAYRLKYLPTNGEALGGFLGRLEPVARWGQVLDAGPFNLRQLALGLNYWLYESVPLKFSYEINWGAQPDNRLFVQVSYGF
jgi:hypothetical protein